MICSGLKNNKLSIKDAIKKYEEFLDLDLIDEEHQEEVEELLAQLEEDEYYWDTAKKDYFRSKEDYVDSDYDEDFLIEEVSDSEDES